MGKLRRFIYEGFMPVTKILLLLSGSVFLLSYILRFIFPLDINNLLVLTTDNYARQLWTFVTYPLVNPGFLTILFAMLWLWFVGGNLEQTWGAQKYLWFWIGVTLVTGLAMTFTAYFLHNQGFVLAGLWLPLTGITWAWAEIYPERELLFWGIIPIQARWLAWLQAAISFFSYAPIHPLLGLAALSGIIVYYFFNRRRGYPGRSVSKFSLKDWLTERKRKARRKKLRVIH